MSRVLTGMDYLWSDHTRPKYQALKSETLLQNADSVETGTTTAPLFWSTKCYNKTVPIHTTPTLIVLHNIVIQYNV